MRLIKSVQLNHKGVLSKRKGLYVIDGQKRLVTQENYVPEGRTLHLIDLENLMGGPWAGGQALRGAVLSYRRVAVVGEHDIATLGVNPGLYVVAVICARKVWSSAKVVFGAGPNGADMALLDRVKDHPESTDGVWGFGAEMLGSASLTWDNSRIYQRFRPWTRRHFL